MRSTTHLTVALVAIALAGAACGGGSAGDNAEGDATSASFVVQGEETLTGFQMPTAADAAVEGGAGAAESSGASGSPTDVSSDDDPVAVEAFADTSDTVPQNEDNEPAALGLFEALAVFTKCLGDEGHEFVGRPDPAAEATDPVNDSGYVEALTKCAAISQIGQAFASMQAESESLDAAGIEERNRQLVHWTDCMEGRGWTIDGVTTDDRGLNQPAGLEPPDGQSLLESADMGECATVAGDAYEEELAAEGNN